MLDTCSTVERAGDSAGRCASPALDSPLTLARRHQRLVTGPCTVCRRVGRPIGASGVASYRNGSGISTWRVLRRCLRSSDELARRRANRRSPGERIRHSSAEPRRLGVDDSATAPPRSDARPRLADRRSCSTRRSPRRLGLVAPDAGDPPLDEQHRRQPALPAVDAVTCGPPRAGVSSRGAATTYWSTRRQQRDATPDGPPRRRAAATSARSIQPVEPLDVHLRHLVAERGDELAGLRRRRHPEPAREALRATPARRRRGGAGSPGHRGARRLGLPAVLQPAVGPREAHLRPLRRANYYVAVKSRRPWACPGARAPVGSPGRR